MKKKRAPRVLLGITEVAGFNAGLKRGLVELGVPVRLFVVDENPFHYGNEDTAWVLRWLRAARVRRRAIPPRALARRVLAMASEVLARAALVGYIAIHFDVVVFVYGVTPLRGRELRFLRLLRTTVIVVYVGSDERLPYMSGAVLSQPDVTPQRLAELTATQAGHVARLDRGADWIVSHHLSGHLHRRPFVPLLWLGLPVADVSRETSASTPDRVRILHAPSSQGNKGTPEIRAAIANIISRGHAIEYEEITGRPNAEVMAALGACDFVVDELWSDSPMAVLATEAAWTGKPAVVGGYGWGDLRAAVDTDDLPPTMLCHPDDLEKTIETMVTDTGLRRDLGQRAHRFVSERWASRAVAERILGIITGAIEPPTYDPAAITYPFGCGQPADRVKTVVHDLVAECGPSALAVDDKPALRRRLLDLIASS